MSFESVILYSWLYFSSQESIIVENLCLDVFAASEVKPCLLSIFLFISKRAGEPMCLPDYANEQFNLKNIQDSMKHPEFDEQKFEFAEEAGGKAMESFF